MPDLSSGHSYWDHSGLEWTSLMSKEGKIPCIEAASFFHGISYSPFLHRSGIHLCWLTKDSFPDFVSCNKVWLCLPRHCAAWLSRDLTKVLWKAELVEHTVDPIKKVRCEHLGTVLVSLSQTWRRYNRCFLRTGREILIKKHSFNV